MAKTELEEAGLETEGMVDSTAKLRSEILALSGVDIMENANEFKSTYKIMDELAVKWKDLTDIQQASITELIAGKRQGNIVSSLMTNFDTARDALETSINSAGSAMAEHEKWQQSLEAQINNLKASWQGLSQAFLKSDFLKFTLNGVTSLTDGLTKLIDTFGTLPTLLGTVAAGFSLFKNKGFFTFDKQAKSIQLFGNNLSGLKGNLSKISTAITTYNSNLGKSTALQNAYIDAISRQNSGLGKYLSSLRGSKASFTGYIGSLIASKAATIALEAATIALNAALTMGIAFAIQAIFTALDKWIVTNKELAETVEEVTSKFEEQHKELQKLKGDYNTDNESSMINRYEKLSKGVDNLGRNVALTADEYSEYQNIVNKIADQMPSLVTGFDSQGNAILSCKDNVAALTAEYERLIKANNDSILTDNLDKIAEDYKNKLSTKDNQGFWKSLGSVFFLDDLGWMDIDMSGTAVDYLKQMVNAKNDTELDGIISKMLGRSDALHNYEGQIRTALESAGYDTGTLGFNIDEVLKDLAKNNPRKLQEIINKYEVDLEQAATSMKAAAKAALSNALDISDSEYYGISDTMKNVANNIVNSLDNSFYSNYVDNPYGIVTYVNDMLSQLKAIGEEDGANIEAAFNLKTQFNGGEIPYGEYVKGLENTGATIDKWVSDGKLDKDIGTQLKLSIGLNEEGLVSEYQQLKNRLTSDEYSIKMSTEDAEAFLNELTVNEHAVAVDLIVNEKVDFSNFNADSLRKYIEEQTKLREALSFDADIEVDTTALETLNEILAESASACGLSSEAIDSLTNKYKDLDSFNPSTLFEATANGVKVNRDELAKLEKEYNNLTKSEVQKHLDTLVDNYNDVTKEIDNCTNASERAAKMAERETYADKIEELATYQAQLEGVTGAYQRWIDAQNTPEDYEGYQAVATGREDIEDEIDRGFISNATKEYIDLLSGEDLVGGTIDDYYAAWEKLDKKVGSTSYSIHDFFTVNDDGDITSTGIDRFFKGLQQDFKGSVAKFNDKTSKWEYDFSQKNLEKIQKEWGIGIEAIELLLEAAASAGYDVDWSGILDSLDLDTSSFETLVSVAESAQKELNKLKGYEDLDFNFETTGITEATTEVEKARKIYNDLIYKDGKLNLEAEGAEQMQVILTTLLVQKQQLSVPAVMKVDTSQIDQAKTDVIDVINKAKELQKAYENYEIAITTGVDVESAKADLNSAIEGMKGTSVDVRAQLKLPTDEELTNAANSVGSIKVGATLDDTAVGALATKIQTECTPEVIAKVTGLDETAIQDGSQKVVYTADHKDVDDFINSLTDISKKIIYTYATEGTKPNPSDINRNIIYKYKTEGDVPEVNGTANANGTAQFGRAFARGNWGIKGSGTALVGELGMETLVRGGHFYTIGDNGAEFIKYRQGDIIFNHKQTEELFKNGKVTSDGGRGKMFVNGSAFANGSYPSSGEAYWNASASSSNFASKRLKKKTTKKSTSSKSPENKKIKLKVKDNEVEIESTSSSGGTHATETNFSQQNAATSEDKLGGFEEAFDWIEVLLSRLERAIDNLDKTVNDASKSWEVRNDALTQEINKVGEEKTQQTEAANAYLLKARDVGLNKYAQGKGDNTDYESLVQSGAIDFDTIKDEALAEKIKEYQDWYEKVLKAEDAIKKLEITEAQLYQQRFENIQSQYDGILQGYEHTESMLNEYISQAEAKGHIVSKNYYQALFDNEENRIAELESEQAALIAKRDEAVESGAIVKGSQAWYDMCAEIDGVTQAIEAGNTALIEYANSMRDIDWEVFDLIQERISDITAEADFLIDLMGYDKLFDDNGKLTDKGMATMGLHGQNYNAYMYQADEYGAKVKEIDSKIASGELDGYSKEVIDKRREYVESQRESILAAEDEKQAIKDLVEEGINLELDALQERIDLHNEELESMKDLYDYQKNVEEQTKNIASLQKQLRAYEGFDDEETRATVQKLKVELESAQQDLQETEYDKYIADQSALLDELFLEYENVLNARLDDTNSLITQVIDAVNIAAGAEGTIATALGAEGAIAKELAANGVTIKSTLETEAKNVGTTLSTAMKGIWSVDEGNAKSVITEYGKGFQDKQTTTNAVLGDIKAYINRMVDDVDKDATTKIKKNKTATSAKKDPTKTNTTKKTANTTKKSTGGDGTPKVGDKVKFLSGKYYYDSQGKTPAGSKNHGKQVYITNINKKSWATHPYHISTGKKLGSGDLGWLKLNQISGYATGKKNFSNDEVAWTQEDGREFIVRPSDGAILTPIAKRDSILTSAASNNIWDMANSPAEFIKDNLNLGATNVPNNSAVQSNYTQHLDKVVFNLPNVKNYEELLSAMQKDKNFERLILSMTIDQIAGKSSLGKGKSIR